MGRHSSFMGGLYTAAPTRASATPITPLLPACLPNAARLERLLPVGCRWLGWCEKGRWAASVVRPLHSDGRLRLLPP